MKLGRKGMEQIMEISLSKEEETQLQNSAAAVEQLVDVLKKNDYLYRSKFVLTNFVPNEILVGLSLANQLAILSVHQDFRGSATRVVIGSEHEAISADVHHGQVVP